MIELGNIPGVLNQACKQNGHSSVVVLMIIKANAGNVGLGENTDVVLIFPPVSLEDLQR